MKDINYFLETEKDFNNNPAPKMIMTPYGFEHPYEALSFLRLGHFNALAEQALKNNGIKNLNSTEWLILFCFMGRLSGYFRDDIYWGETPELAKNMQEVLDSVILKAPKFNGNILYRFLKDHDKHDFEIGEIFTSSTSLTTTTDNWNQSKDTYVITPKQESETMAHSLYELYNHGNENQVNFERGAKFQVKDIEDKTNYKLIYLYEI